MNVHELTLQNYAAGGGCPSACQPTLYLGTAGSYGNEQINVVLGEGWQGLTVKAVFQPSGVPVVVPDGGGVISVPWEATQSVVAYPNGRISFQGYVSGRLVNTSDVPYTVGGSSAGSDNTPAPTPDEFQQFVDAVKSDADRAAQAAADAEAAVQKVTNAGTQAVTDIGNAKDSALEAIDAAREEAAGSISADVEGAKQAAADAEQSAADAEQSAKNAADALANVQAAGQSALDDIATERQNTLSDIQNEGAKQQSAVAGAGTAALEAIGQTEQAAINQVRQAGATQASAVQSAGTTQISQVNSAGAAQVQAVKDEGAGQTAALNDAAEAHKNELESIASHPPQPNTATGKWQTWNAETGAYQDTDALYQGGYYMPAVSDDGVLTWQGSQAGMPSLPSANIKGPKGDKGDPGLGVPATTTSDAGKVPPVKADGSAYELAGPYAPLSAAIRPTASGNPVSITDSVEWPLQGFTVYGKSTQNGTPSPESPVPIVSAGASGSIETTITGKNLLTGRLYYGKYTSGFAYIQNETVVSLPYKPILENEGICQTVSVKKGKTYTFSATNPNTNARLFLALYRTFEDTSDYDNAISNVEGLPTISITPSEDGILVCLIAGTWTDGTTKIHECTESELLQLEIGSTATAYETPHSQSITATTPTGLPGIPVDYGGNFTDASGQRRWVDIIDYNNEKKYQYINETVVDGTNIKFTVDRSGYYWNLPDNSAPSGVHISAAQINKYFPSSVFSINEAADYIFTTTRLMAPYFETIEELNAFCVQKNTEGDPLTIMYVMDTPIETPLSPEELAAYRALHTYDGSTVVSTAEDVAGLEVKYVADAQKYIDDRLAAAESHIQEIAAAQLNAQTGG